MVISKGESLREPFRLVLNTILQLRYESKISLEMLSNDRFDQFEAAFILKTDAQLQKYDFLAR